MATTLPSKAHLRRLAETIAGTRRELAYERGHRNRPVEVARLERNLAFAEAAMRVARG